MNMANHDWIAGGNLTLVLEGHFALRILGIEMRIAQKYVIWKYRSVFAEPVRASI